jgi:hypothetical protein
VAEVIICSRHWDRLRQLVCERGLGHLIHHPHDDLDELAADLCGQRRAQVTFNPMATARALATAEAEQLPSADPDGCPLCELIGSRAGLRFAFGISAEAYWPAVIVDDVVSQARERGLTPRAA